MTLFSLLIHILCKIHWCMLFQRNKILLFSYLSSKWLSFHSLLILLTQLQMSYTDLVQPITLIYFENDHPIFKIQSIPNVPILLKNIFLTAKCHIITLFRVHSWCCTLNLEWNAWLHWVTRITLNLLFLETRFTSQNCTFLLLYIRD